MPGEIRIVEGEWRLTNGAGRGMISTANRREFTRLIYHPGTRKLTWTQGMDGMDVMDKHGRTQMDTEKTATKDCPRCPAMIL